MRVHRDQFDPPSQVCSLAHHQPPIRVRFTNSVILSILSSSVKSRIWAMRHIGNSVPNPLWNSTPCTNSCQVPLCANPRQQLTSGQRPLLFGVRRDLIRGAGGKCSLPTIRNCQPSPLATPHRRLITLRRMCHLYSAELPPQCLVDLQFRYRPSIDTRIVQ